MRWRLPLFVHLSAVFAALLTAAFALLGLHSLHQDRRMALIAADNISRPTMQTITLEVQRLFGSARQTADLLAASRFAEVNDHARLVAVLPLIVRALAAVPAVSNIYVGRDDGSFFSVLPLQRGISLPIAPPAGAVYATREVAPAERNPELELWSFFDAQLSPLAPSIRTTSDYDPRARPWYLVPGSGPHPRLTDAYGFNTGEIGITAMRRAEAVGSVVGVDIRLPHMHAVLAAQRLTPGTELALIDAQGRVLASARGETGVHPFQLPDVPVLAALAAMRGQVDANGLFDLDADGHAWKATIRRVAAEDGPAIDILMAIPLEELLADINHVQAEARRMELAIASVAILIVFILSWIGSRRLKRLDQGARAMRALQFNTDFSLPSRISEIDALAGTLGSAQETIRRLLHIGRALMEERDMERLFTRLLQETVAATDAVRGTLVLIDPESGGLRLARAADASGPIAIPEALSEALASGPKGDPLHRALRERRTVVVDPGVGGAETAMSDTFGAGRLIIVPLYDHDAAAEGVVCLTVPIDAQVGTDLLRFVEALCGSSAVAIETARLMQAQKDLLTGFIRVIATAIDAKSAHTGAHCQRVPELTLALSAAADRSQAPAFADYHLDAQQTEELRLAAWLHDCGKVTTPEWVVDKATRLECVQNRIHEIRTRFEILWRDAEIAALREAQADTGDANERREAAQRALTEDFAFVAECNLGTTVMDAKRLHRLQAIAARRWTRHFDDSLGLSAEELTRHGDGPPPPVEESLLADKPSHRIPQPGLAPDYLAAGFKAAAPVYAFDFGELHNLSVPRGTLTAEERFKINEHVMQTILMLRRLPLPHGLRHVPEIAGAHHEHLSGGGYPVGLTAAELTLPQRILAVADVFEALTAADRPYKTAKTAAEALTIMRGMARQGHLDGDVVELLEESGIAQGYLERMQASRGKSSQPQLVA